MDAQTASAVANIHGMLRSRENPGYFKHVKRSPNKRADLLASEALDHQSAVETWNRSAITKLDRYLVGLPLLVE